MATVADLIVKIGGDSSGLQKELAASQRQIKRSFSPEALALSNTAKNMLVGLAAAMGIVGVASVKMSADFAASKTAFTQLLGSADKAQKMMEDLTQFAAETPFELKGLTESAKKLLAFQFAAEDIIPIMSAVGDAVALVGGGQEAIDGVVRALGQIQAKGKLSAEEMNQLAERGINGWQYIAESMGISVAEVMNLCQQGAIDSTTAINAVVAGMQTNFVGGMDAMSKTVPGLLSTIKDNASMVMKEIGDSLTEALDLKGILTNVANWLTTFATVVKTNGLKEAIQGLIPPEVIAGIFAFGGALVGTAVAALVLFKTAIIAALAPFAPFIAAGAAVGAIAYEIWNNWEPLSELFSTLWETITQYFKDAWGIIANIIDSTIGWALTYISDGWNAVGETTASVWGGIVDWIDNAWTSIKQTVAEGIKWVVDKMQPLLDMVKNAMPESVKNLFSNLASGVEKMTSTASKLHWGGIDVSEATSQKNPEVNKTFTGLHSANANSSAPVSGGSSGSDKSMAQAVKEISAINKEITDLQNKVPALASEYAKLSADIAFTGLHGSEEVYGQIEREKTARIQSVTDWLDKVKAATVEAETIRQRAQESGDADAITNATALCEARKQAEIQAETDTQTQIKAIELQSQTDRLSQYTAYKAAQAEIDYATQEGNLTNLQAFLDSEKAAVYLSYEDKKSYLTEYLAAWKAAHVTMASQALTLTNGVSSAFGDAFRNIINGTKSSSEAWKDLGKTIKNTIADMVADFIAAEIKIAAMKFIGSLFGFCLGGSVETGFGKGSNPGTTGASDYAAGGYILGEGTSTSDSIPAMLSNGEYVVNAQAVKSIGVGVLDRINRGIPIPAFGYANGGLVGFAPSVTGNGALVGFAPSVTGNGAPVLATQNIYGDINTGADAAEMYADFSDMVINGRRGR